MTGLLPTHSRRSLILMAPRVSFSMPLLMPVFVALFLATFVLLGLSREGRAGVLVAPGLIASSWSFDPEASEPTPNYAGVGLNLSLGWSFEQVFDAAVWMRHQPGFRGAPALLGAEDAALQGLGIELALRLSKGLYLGVRTGTGFYEHLSVATEDEVPGSWSGPLVGVSLGALFPTDRQTSWQVAFDLMQLIASQDSGPPAAAHVRRITSAGLCVTWVFNGWSSAALENNFFRSFLKSSWFR